MAMTDYYLCDVCGQKCFYDSNLNWEFDDRDHKIPDAEKVRGTGGKLDYCGDMACICTDCAKTHQCVVVKMESARPASEPKPVAYFTDWPGSRVYSAIPHGFDGPGLRLDGESIAEYWEPLFTRSAPAGVVLPDGYLIVERGFWKEEQIASAAKCIELLKNVPGMTNRDLAMAAMDAGQCKAPEINLSDLACLNEAAKLNGAPKCDYCKAPIPKQG